MLHGLFIKGVRSQGVCPMSSADILRKRVHQGIIPCSFVRPFVLVRNKFVRYGTPTLRTRIRTFGRGIPCSVRVRHPYKNA